MFSSRNLSSSACSTGDSGIEFPVRGLPVARELYCVVPFPVVWKGIKGFLCEDILEIPEHGWKELMKCLLLFRIVPGMPFRNPLRHSARRTDLFHGSVAISRCKDSGLLRPALEHPLLPSPRRTRPQLLLRGSLRASSLTDSGRLGRDFLSKSRNTGNMVRYFFWKLHGNILEKGIVLFTNFL